MQKHWMRSICTGLAILLTAAAGTLLPAATVSAEEETFTDETITYRKVTGGVNISTVSQSVSQLTLHRDIDGYPILGIDENAFAQCTGLTSVDMKEASALLKIGKGAFSGCTKLETIQFPDSLETIGEGAFYNCAVLQTASLSENVKSIGAYAFAYCFQLTDLKLPDQLTLLDEGLFYYDYSLKNIELPKSLETISPVAFAGCYSLESLSFPASLSSVDAIALRYCASIHKFEVEAGNKTFSIGEDDALYSADGTELICYPAGNGKTECTIPDTVKTLKPYSLSGSVTLEKITLPEALRSQQLPSGIFSDCIALKSVNYEPSALEIVPAECFSGCKNLESISLPDNCTAIGDYAFYDCAALTEVKLPESLTEIGVYAFCGCTNLKTMTVPKDTKLDEFSVGYALPDAETGSTAQLSGFVLHGKVGSTAIEYAKKNGLNYKQDGIDWILVGGIALIVVLVILIVLCVIRLKKNIAASRLAADEAESDDAESEEFFDENYQSILAADAEDDEFDRNFGDLKDAIAEDEDDEFDRNYGFSVKEPQSKDEETNSSED